LAEIAQARDTRNFVAMYQGLELDKSNMTNIEPLAASGYSQLENQKPYTVTLQQRLHNLRALDEKDNRGTSPQSPQ